MIRHTWRWRPSYTLLGAALLTAALTVAVQAQKSEKPTNNSTETAKPAELILYVPTNAEVWFDEDKTTQTGPVRIYETPALRPGRDFEYKIKIRWKQGADIIERNHPVTIRAGDEITLHFTKTQTSKKWLYYHVPSGTAWESPPDWDNPISVDAAKWRVFPASNFASIYRAGPPPPDLDSRSW
jgi:uncharacterized protein (TIGR03000 family)